MDPNQGGMWQQPRPFMNQAVTGMQQGFPQPGPSMYPGQAGMWQGYPQQGPMMGTGGPGGGMWPGYPQGQMMGQGGMSMWPRFPQYGPGMGQPQERLMEPWMGQQQPPENIPASDPGTSHYSQSYSKADEDPDVHIARDYQEPDSSSSTQGRRHRSRDVPEEVDYFVGPYCEVCELHLSSEHMLWSHMSGKKHLKAMKALDAGRPLPKKIQERKEDPSSSSNVEYSSFERAFKSLTADEPVVGLGFLVEVPDEEELTCELCDSKCNQNNMVLHVIGLKHRMTYLKKCDPERYGRLRKQQKRSKLTEDTRQLCKEVESSVGRGRPRYKGPRQTQTEKETFEARQLSKEERRMAIEDLKRVLMQDFMSRNIDADTAQEMLREKLELLKVYEKRGVPFDLAKERVLEDEDRWSLLLEFERQTLSFEEAEERITYRMNVLKAHIVNDIPKEEARKNVLDDEVVRDFRKDFQRMGMEAEQAQKHVEKRLWMLERLHFKGYSQEDASQKVLRVEQELSRLMQRAKRDAGSAQVPEFVAWRKAAEDLENFIQTMFSVLQLSSAQREKYIKAALAALDRYKGKKLVAEKSLKKVLVDDLPIPEDETDEDSAEEEDTARPEPSKKATPPPSKDCARSSGSSSVGSKEDVLQRVKVFMTKLHALLQIDKQGSHSVDREKQLAMFDQLSQLEMQNLLSDMCKAVVNANEAKERFVHLFQQHENLRKSLFPFSKESSAHERLSGALKMFLRFYNLSQDEPPAQSSSQASSKKKASDDSPKRERTRSRSHSRSKIRKSRSRRSRSSSNDRSLSGGRRSPRHSKHATNRYSHLSKKRSRSRSSSHHRSQKSSKYRKSKQSPSSSRRRSRSSSSERDHSPRPRHKHGKHSRVRRYSSSSN